MLSECLTFQSIRDPVAVQICHIDFGQRAGVIVVRVGASPIGPAQFGGENLIADTRFVYQLREHILYLLHGADVDDIEILHRLVRAVAVDGADADDFLPESAVNGNIDDAVEPDFIFDRIEDPFSNVQSFGVEGINGGGPGKPEFIAFARFPQDAARDIFFGELADAGLPHFLDEHGANDQQP